MIGGDVAEAEAQAQAQAQAKGILAQRLAWPPSASFGNLTLTPRDSMHAS
jgi:hypothetical protein